MSKLKFIYSAMNAGKSFDLLRTAHTYERLGRECLILKSSIDNREGPGMIASRVGFKKGCTLFNPDTDLKMLYMEKIHEHKIRSKFSAILVDEAQFMTEQQVWDLAFLCDTYQLPVLCYGLRTDSNGNAFAGSKVLLAVADSLSEIKTLCHCGKKATMTLRVIDGEVCKNAEQIMIGAEDLYISVCRRHWSENKYE